MSSDLPTVTTRAHCRANRGIWGRP